MKLIFVVLSLGLLSACFSDGNLPHPYEEASRGVAARVNISALSTGEANELRLWKYNGLVDDLQMISVNESMLKECSVMKAFNEQYAKFVQYTHCSEYSLGMNEQQLAKLLVDNLALDKKDISCPGIMDGEAGLVEGRYHGKWFAYQYETPDECQTHTVLQLRDSLKKFKASL